MRLTLVLLLAWVQIYCNSTVLSLPPSLIADAASLASQQQELQQQLQSQQRQQAATIPLNTAWHVTKKWKKKNMQDTLGDRSTDSSNVQPSNRLTRNSNINSNKHNFNPILSRTDSLPIFAASAIPNTNSNNNQKAQQQDQPNLLQFPNEYEINSLLSVAVPQDEQRVGRLLTADATADSKQQTSPQPQPTPLQPPAIAPSVREIEWNEFFSPMKYLARRCQPTLDNDCLRKYAMEQQHKLQRIGNRLPDQNDNFDDLIGVPSALTFASDRSAQYVVGENSAEDNDDVLMMLTGEEDLIKFLHWAMQQLQPKELLKNFTKDGIAIEANQWKKLNLSGQREPVLFVEEPRYMIVRREPTPEDLEERLRIKAEPFIPPRGRKYQQMPELEKLLNRYDTFVPNRGRRDKIKDIFKYDDLFFPNRGKKQNTAVQYQVVKPQQQQQQRQPDDFYASGMMTNAVDIRLLPPTPTTSNAFRPWSHKNDCLEDSSVLADRQSLLDVYNKARMHVACNNNYNNNRYGEAVSSSNETDDDGDNDDDDQNGNDNEIADNDVDNWPRPRMPANDVKINEYDQSVKISMPTREMSTLAFLRAQAVRGAQQTQQRQQQSHHQQQWSINNKGKIAAALVKVLAAAAAAPRQHRFGEVAVDADGVAANRLHSTRSMLTMQQQQQQQKQRGIFPASMWQTGVPAYDKRWLQLSEFNKNWLLDQQSKQRQQKQQQQQFRQRRNLN